MFRAGGGGSRCDGGVHGDARDGQRVGGGGMLGVGRRAGQGQTPCRRCSTHTAEGQQLHVFAGLGGATGRAAVEEAQSVQAPHAAPEGRPLRHGQSRCLLHKGLGNQQGVVGHDGELVQHLSARGGRVHGTVAALAWWAVQRTRSKPWNETLSTCRAGSTWARASTGLALDVTFLFFCSMAATPAVATQNCARAHQRVTGTGQRSAGAHERGSNEARAL